MSDPVTQAAKCPNRGSPQASPTQSTNVPTFIDCFRFFDGQKLYFPTPVSPSPGVHSINNVRTRPTLSVNGMKMNTRGMLDLARMIADESGLPVIMIPNNTETFLKDVRNCVISAFSNSKGMEVELGAAYGLAMLLRERMQDSEPIDVACYSQGTLITKNVLTEMWLHLKSEGRQAEWDSFASRLRIKSFGAAVHVWPPGVQATESRHTRDGVAYIGDILAVNDQITNTIRRNLTGGEKLVKADVVYLSYEGDPHSWKNYLENSPRFYLEKISSLSIDKQADTILKSMNEGEFSNKFYQRTIKALSQISQDGQEQPQDRNRAIELSRALVAGLTSQENSPARRQLDEQAIEDLTTTSARKNVAPADALSLLILPKWPG